MAIVADSMPAEQRLRDLMAASLRAERAEHQHQDTCRARAQDMRCEKCLVYERVWLEAEVAVERFLTGDE